MGKRLVTTPRSKVRTALRQLFLRSREHASALQREHYCCEECGAKQSKAKGKEAKVEVHHLNGIEWDNIIEYVFRHLLCDPKDLEVLCKACHAKETARQREAMGSEE